MSNALATPAATDVCVEISGLKKEFFRHNNARTHRAIDDVSFAVTKGDFFTLLGPSGCGKTTTLRCLAGLETADGGEITMDGTTVFSADTKRDVAPNDRPIAMVPQSYGIWPHMTVFDNAAFPLRYGRRTFPNHETKRRVSAMLAQVGLSDYADRWSTQLSGGQQQRLALARALLCEPEVLLLDEPLSNLDAKLRAQLRAELRSFQQRFGVTTIYVTHDQTEALAMSDTIVVMNRGRIEQIGSPDEIYEAPASRFVADFVGSANLIPGVLDGPTPSAGGAVDAKTEVGTIQCGRSAPAAGPLSPGQELTVCVRPENIRVLAEPAIQDVGPNCFQARVETTEYLGDRQEMNIVIGDVALRAHGPAHPRVQPGDDVTVVLEPARTIALWA
ncbi:ABC transporter ATP-binding protein [Pseudonocardia sp. HH130629-09]|uniref:ABC transporter ATP-binding protein n=1 Tax=Pseudonocardia sp. HH130629-09 TaxID=1641402 RepID=UPI0006CB2F03|nr:ABC transporter ATP-binding protein [Pseudonocardia sp. HH130629-09]ALE83962.1 ABC transporter ATP-binding protein [Pseudonocardia sp. HH130629-09]